MLIILIQYVPLLYLSNSGTTFVNKYLFCVTLLHVLLFVYIYIILKKFLM